MLSLTNNVDKTSKELFNNFKNYYLSNELQKGKSGSSIIIICMNIINYYLYTYYGMDIFKSTFLSIFVFGNILSYIVDIMFTKENIMLPKYNGHKNYYGFVPFSDHKARGEFLMRSLISHLLIKFVILSIIDTIINLSLLKFLIKLSDNYEIFNELKYRKVIFAAFTSTLTFSLFINQLRFQWAYESKNNFMFDMQMYIWFTLILLIVVGIENNSFDKIKGNIFAL